MPFPWMREPERQSSTFASKTQKTHLDKVLTSEIDFLNKPELVGRVLGDAPGHRGFTWTKHDREIVITNGGDGILDRYYDCDFGAKQSLASGIHTSHRKYASSFTSTTKRFPPRVQQHDLGPGAYEMPASSVQVKDAKRMNYGFKSETTGSSFTREANEPPDAIQSSQYADQAKHWTSKGLAFSTRERFPRQRPKWKD